MRYLLPVAFFTGIYISIVSFASFPRSTFICPITTLGFFSGHFVQILGLLIDAFCLVILAEAFNADESPRGAPSMAAPAFLGFVLLVRCCNLAIISAILTSFYLTDFECPPHSDQPHWVRRAPSSVGLGTLDRPELCGKPDVVGSVLINCSCLCFEISLSQFANNIQDLMYVDLDPWPVASGDVSLHPNSLHQHNLPRAIQRYLGFLFGSNAQYRRAVCRSNYSGHHISPSLLLDK